MKLQAYQYRIPLVSPLETSRRTISHREGLIVAFINGDYSLFGEAAPLPGFSKESLTEVKESFLANRSRLLSLLEQGEEYDSSPIQDLPPSLSFALDSIFFQQKARNRDRSLPSFLFKQAQTRIPVNAVVSLHSGNALKKMAQLVEAGFTTVKAKVGIDFGPELKTVRKLRENFPDLAIRLDANGAWSLEEALENCAGLADLGIEYLEEPLANSTIENWKTLAQNITVPLAVDESQLRVSWWKKLLPYSSYLILKPMFKGSFRKIFESRKIANSLDNKIVFTTTFESGIGRYLTAALASGLGDSQTAHGLATGQMLAADFVAESDYISDGYFSFGNKGEEPIIDFDRLPEPISIKQLI